MSQKENKDKYTVKTFIPETSKRGECCNCPLFVDLNCGCVIDAMEYVYVEKNGLIEGVLSRS